MERIQVTVERSYRKDIIFLISVYLVFFLLSGRNEKYEEILFWAFLLVAAAAAFVGLMLRIVKNVMQNAVAISEENELTI